MYKGIRKKILIIRFNSIGDIVLTSPVVDSLFHSGYEVHYLVKSSYSSVLENNEHITRLWLYDDNYSELIRALRSEAFDHIVDLHNNLRSRSFRLQLRCPSLVLKKNRISDFLLTRFRFARQQRKHIVHRFLETIEALTGKSNYPKLRYSFSKNSQQISYQLPFESYVCIAVGTAYATKDIPLDKLLGLVRMLDENIVLLGGPSEMDKARQIIEAMPKKPIVDLTGKLIIDQSAYLVSRSKMLLCGDTGLMHIAAALSIPTVSVFGSTHPILGYTPFYADETTPRALVQNERLSCRPCTRQGREICPRGHFKCMRAISVEELHAKVEGILKS